MFHGVSWGLLTLVTQQVYDSVADIVTKNETVGHAYLMISALGLTAIITHVLNGVAPFLRNDFVHGKLNGEMAKIIHEKMARIDPLCFENTKFHDDINKASGGAGSVLGTVNTIVDIFCYYVGYFVFMGFYLHHLKPMSTR
jgi:ATP-binding cassette subfamily B protein